MSEDERLEELAKAMYCELGYRGTEWDAVGNATQSTWLRIARAACEFFFGSNDDGEVIVPAKRSGAALVKAVLACEAHRRGGPGDAASDALDAALALLPQGKLDDNARQK